MSTHVSMTSGTTVAMVRQWKELNIHCRWRVDKQFTDWYKFCCQVVLLLLQCLVVVQVRIADTRQRKTRSPDSDSDGDSAVIGVSGFPGFPPVTNQSPLASLVGNNRLPATRDQLIAFLASQQFDQSGMWHFTIVHNILVDNLNYVKNALDT